MATLHIHQNIVGFKRKYAGFTARQWLTIIVAVILFAATIALLWWRAALPFQLASLVALLLALLPATIGFAEYNNMRAETIAKKLMVLSKTPPTRAIYVSISDDYFKDSRGCDYEKLAKKASKNRRRFEQGY